VDVNGNAQVGTDEEFMAEVRDARENGYDVLCAECGTGMAGDGMEMHVRGCSQFVEPRS
jgi:hypothetical protein